MKKLLTLILCWLLAFSAIAETTFKAKTAASVAGGYVTSLNKVDGSFEDGSTQWSASVGTIVPTASTEFQGNKYGLWSGTGTGTLDLQWTATASNTYEATAQVDVQGEDDVYVCAYVGTTETGCKLIPALSKIQKVSVVADSVMSSAFYLRLKHTGSDAFNVKVDDGKIEPLTPQSIGVVEQESMRYGGANLLTTTGVIRFSNTGFNTLPSKLFSYDSATGYFTTKKKIVLSGGASLGITTNSQLFYLRRASDSAILATSSNTPPAPGYFAAMPFSVELNTGESIYFDTPAVLANNSADRISITATAISENVVQSYAPSEFLGELRFLPQNISPKGFIPAMGSSIGKSSGTYQGDAYYELYKLLWTQSSVTAGEPYVISSAKGADALTDWNAAKTITIDVSGLFVRAYKSGTSGAVGAKQLDAFQGHEHRIGYYSVVGTRTDSFVQANDLTSWSTNSNLQNGYNDDGTNGTPRTASETRPTNIAQYAFIRYGNDAPTLLALPTSKENVFSARISSAGSIVSQSSDWATSTRNNVGIYTINYSKLGLTATPSFSASYDDVAIGLVVQVYNVSTTSATVRVMANDDGAGTLFDKGISVILQKQSPDYTAPGVFVGNVAKNQVATVEYWANGSPTTLTTSPVAMPITRITGDSSIASSSGAQFTLQPGEYEISGEALAYAANASAYIFNYLYDVTAGAEVRRGFFTGSSGTIAMFVYPRLPRFRITLTSAKTFEWRFLINASSGYTLGHTTAAPNDLGASITITKLNGQ